ncbi:MAG: MarR family transcriptional regulator [Saprospiraceae bacterium]|nr:MarR family transcriptional regulator [Saprospiraceae bacterium]
MGTFEEEIKQQVFKNDVLKAMLNVMYTANWIRDQHASVFKAYGILQQHYNVLRIVRGRKGNPVTPGEIIKVMLDKGRDLTRLVDKLVKLGYLERKPSKFNKRKMDITITEEGLTVTSEIEVKLENWLKEKIDVSIPETEILNNLLDKMRGSD